MKISIRRSKEDADEVQWLEPTRLRAPRRAFSWIGVIALLLIAGSVAVIAAVVFGGAKPGVPTAREASAPASVARSAPEPAPAPAPAPQAVLPPPASEPPPLAAAPPEPAPPVESVPPATEPAAPQTSVAGAFPPPTSTGPDDPEGPYFAVYLNESAPDEAGARLLLGEAQRKYGSALAGGRLSYRRVRVNDGYAWRLRLSGLTRARAEDACQSLTGLGAECEVGPR